MEGEYFQAHYYLSLSLKNRISQQLSGGDPMKRSKAIMLPILALILLISACSNNSNQTQNVNSSAQVQSENNAAEAKTKQQSNTTTQKQGENVQNAQDLRKPMTESEAQIPEWSKNAVIYEVNVRQYTKEGTFKAFEEHLPRLQEMGVDVLWFMPIHPISEEKRLGTLGSYYSIQDYKGVNPEFGTAEDFKALVDKAHSMGFKVMLDWVANHTGWDHEWTKQPDWYTTDEEGNIVHPPGTNWEDVADLNFGSADMSAAMIEAMKYWVTEFDVDGFRADYAGGVPTSFWETARTELDKIKPVLMLAEDDTKLELLNKAFNINYSWEFHKIMNEVAKEEKDVDAIKLYVRRIERLYPGGTYPLQFTSNHDENSWNGTEYERMGEAVKAMAALSFTVPGIPLIYSGQEAGLDKRLAFFDKDEIPWNDLSMGQFYQELTTLKHENPALWNGTDGGLMNVLETSDKKLLAFERTKDDNTVLVVMNLSNANLEGEIQAGDYVGSYKSYPAGEAFELQAMQSIRLEPWKYQIYIK